MWDAAFEEGEKMNDLHLLPKLRDSWSYLYLEHGIIDQDASSIAFHDEGGKIPIPCASLTVLMVGPGTKITHAAVRVLADTGCMVIWCGEQGVRFYASGMGESRDSSRLIYQAKLVSDPILRTKVVIKMYQLRFNEKIESGLTLQQIRGKEGVRIRDAYQKASAESGVEWTGRTYKTKEWNASDPVNKALSAANACLYGLCHAAIVSLGYSPGLGFVHTGKSLSFVYDVADLYKTETSIPIAFKAASEGTTNLERTVRQKMREAFKEARLLNRIADDIESILNIDDIDYEVSESDFDVDGSMPGGLWDPSGSIQGGKNYGDETNGNNDIG